MDKGYIGYKLTHISLHFFTDTTTACGTTGLLPQLTDPSNLAVIYADYKLIYQIVLT